ncbi:MAG: phosphatidylserine decarboxylase [Opitutales bacterium]|nr:phosphatidylserine decarboxylase [Opitutales bacterium]MCH8539241.1 phosphatidylserine decarboxylase [Opitutales bacterium]
MSAPIRYFNRKRQQWETEEVYGERGLRWIYGSIPGRWTLWLLVRRKFVSRFYGWLMNRVQSRKKIRPFIEKYRIDTEEMVSSVDEYRTFNEFFYRRLKPSARPLEGGEGDLVFPADGRHLWVRDLGQKQNLFAKGQVFDLPKLVGSEELATIWAGGNAVISRLCPVDYHRFHFPLDAKVHKTKEIDGYYYSVNPWALVKNLGYLWQNRRELLILEHPVVGKVGFLAIGATFVGGIHWSAQIGQEVKKGEEAGYFSFGGSCIVTLWPRDHFFPAEDLKEITLQGSEMLALMGTHMGKYRLE